MSRITVTEPKSKSRKPTGHRARMDDRLTEPRQMSPIDQNHSGLSLLIKQHRDLGIERAGGRGEAARGNSGSRSKKNMHKSREKTHQEKQTESVKRIFVSMSISKSMNKFVAPSHKYISFKT